MEDDDRVARTTCKNNLENAAATADNTDVPHYSRRAGTKDWGQSKRTDARKDEPTVATLDNIFGPNLANFQNALGRTTQRHAMLSNNLANVNTPGFKRKDTDFSIILQQELTPAKERMQSFREQKAQAASDQTSIRVDGNNVDLEHEVMGIAETELRYEALTDMTSNYFAGIKSAIREGR